MEELEDEFGLFELGDDWSEDSVAKVVKYYELIFENPRVPVLPSQAIQEHRPVIYNALQTVASINFSSALEPSTDYISGCNSGASFVAAQAPLPLDGKIRLKRGSYTKPSLQQRDFFIHLIVDKGQSVLKASKICMIPQSTAYDWHRKYNSPGGWQLFKRGRTAKLQPEHIDFLREAFKTDCTLTLSSCVELLYEQFGIALCTSTVHNYMVKQMNMSYKMVTKEVIRRNANKTKACRKHFVEVELVECNARYLENCIFIDEAAFDTNMRPKKGWGKVGEKAKVSVPAARATSFSILGAICAAGVVYLAARDPKVEVPASLLSSESNKNINVKKRKLSGGGARHEPITTKTRGTTAVHFFEFLSKLMDILDQDPHRKYSVLVMDNVSFHKGRIIGDYIKKRGYKALFIPPYSPDLNPIENYWALLKHYVRRTGIHKNNSLSELVQVVSEASRTIEVSSIRSMINHSVHLFSKCIDEDDV